ncbi:ATP-binding cassette domain-containing protein [archaeon]|nr:MAG: ATP-binding cassette domain-containing protein [archaeon]
MLYAYIDIDGQLERIERSLCLRQDILSSPWSTLSGGERQRALIACAVILVTSTQHPTVLLLDEPTAACDPTTTLAVESVLLTCGASILMTTHDERQAKRIAHRRVLLSSVDAS